MSHKILKMMNGDEVVCSLFTDADDHLVVTDPLKLISVPKIDGDEIDESLSLTRWVHFSSDNHFKIDKNKVIVMSSASLGLSKFYEYVLDRLDDDSEYSDEETDYESLIENEPEEEDFENLEDEPKVIH